MPPSRPRPARGARLAAALAVLVLACGCHARDSAAAGPAPRDDEGGYPASPPAAAREPAPGPTTLAFDREPVIGVLLSAGPSASFTTLVPGRVGGRQLAVGYHQAELVQGSVRIDGVALGPQAAVELAAAGEGEPRFRAQARSPMGAAELLSLAGEPLLAVEGGHLDLIERVPLETYLAGVVPTEMPARWPEAALAAQAITARSYACARVLTRAQAPWQLHWHYSVDMAYAGTGAHASAQSSAALASTRGLVLMHHGRPLPALFCAASGGRTETPDHVPNAWEAAYPDLGACMPIVDDPASAPGAAALGKETTHGAWSVVVPLAAVSAGLEAWGRAHPEERLPMGAVTRVRIASRWRDSGRVALVEVRLARGGAVDIPATTFRMAVGPGLVRSTWWDACAAIHGGRDLLVRGHGYGHGMGMSQVSAWELASAGASPEDILARFYQDCTLERLYGQ